MPLQDRYPVWPEVCTANNPAQEEHPQGKTKLKATKLTCI